MNAVELRRQEHLEQTVRNQGDEIKTLKEDKDSLRGIITVLKVVNKKNFKIFVCLFFLFRSHVISLLWINK